MKEFLKNLTLDEYKSVADMLGKAFLALFVLSYILGLVVVNVHLNSFGIYSLSLFQLSYVAAGMWAIFFVALPTITIAGPLLIIFGVREKKPDEQKDMNWVAIGVYFLIVGIMIVQFAFWIPPSAAPSIAWSLLVGLATGAYIFVAFVMGFESSHGFSRLGRFILSTTAALFIVYGHLYEFSTNLYGRIPSYLGGGAPKSAVLVLAEQPDVNDRLSKIGIAFEPDSGIAPVLVLLVTDNEYILVVEKFDGETANSRSVVLPRESVKAVYYN